MPYQTPFVGMFVFSPDYIKMLKNLKYYLSGNIPLTFVKESKYIKDFDNAYPLALLDDIDISHFSFREYGEDVPKRYYSWSQKHGLKSINLIDGKIVIKHPLYTHFQKRTIECPEFELVESFYVIPNKLVFGEELSIQEIEEVTKNKFYWEYVKSTFFKKFKMEKWSLEFIRHKLRMKK